MSERPAPFSGTPPSPGACGFSQAAMLFVDRELTEIELAALETHLESCAACRRHARQAEGLSVILKHWDQERVARIRAPRRLALEIRGAVADVGQQRRSERRLLFASRLAMAASILIVLGGALLFGSGVEPALPELARVDALAPVPRALLSRDAPELDLPARDPLSPAASPLAALDGGVPHALVPLDGEEKAFTEVALVHLELCRRWTDQTEADFAARVGEPAILQTDHHGRMVFLSRGALEFIQDVSGAGNLEGFLRGLQARVEVPGRLPGHEYGEPSLDVDTGRVVTDVLPLPVDAKQLDAWLAKQALVGSETGLRFRAVPAGANTPKPARAAHVYDLARAMGDGAASLRPGTGDDVVLIADGLRHPVFLPRGELIGGGSVDRVVARPTWIPATAGRERFLIPCLPVSSVHDEMPFRAVGLVAGPEIRRLLATEGAGRDEVLTAVMRQTPATGMTYSLLDWYDDPELRRVVKARSRQIHRLGWRGFMVSERTGELRGIEVTSLPVGAAADLMARLWVGYLIEDAVTRHADAAEEEASPLRVTLMNLLSYEGTFRAPPQQGGKHRESRLRDVHSGVLVDSFEERETSATIHAAALP